MALEVVWTRQALRTYVSIVRYLRGRWSQWEIDRFDNEVDRALIAIGLFP